jgi:hypothetical protein
LAMSVETFRTIAPRYVIAAVKEIWLGPGTMVALIRRSHGGSPTPLDGRECGGQLALVEDAVDGREEHAGHSVEPAEEPEVLLCGIEGATDARRRRHSRGEASAPPSGFRRGSGRA